MTATLILVLILSTGCSLIAAIAAAHFAERARGSVDSLWKLRGHVTALEAQIDGHDHRIRSLNGRLSGPRGGRPRVVIDHDTGDVEDDDIDPEFEAMREFQAAPPARAK